MKMAILYQLSFKFTGILLLQLPLTLVNGI